MRYYHHPGGDYSPPGMTVLPVPQRKGISIKADP